MVCHATRAVFYSLVDGWAALGAQGDVFMLSIIFGHISCQIIIMYVVANRVFLGKVSQLHWSPADLAM